MPAVPQATTPADPRTQPDDGSHDRAQGHGRRLTAAFDALEAFPALAASRDRVLSVVGEERPSLSEVIEAVESDVALVVAVMRLANNRPGRPRTYGVPQAIQTLGVDGVGALAAASRTYDFFERAPAWQGAPERFRLHALAVRRAAERIAEEVEVVDRDRLIVGALLHDIGKLVLAHAYRGYPGQVHSGARTPEERLAAERRELGVDHAMVGGVLARRWRLPDEIAAVIDHHHSDQAEGDAAVVRLADMLAHYSVGRAVTAERLAEAGKACGLGPRDLRSIMYDLPLPSRERPRALEPCPLSARELDVLRLLAQGMVYKQIAAEMQLSVSTVRTHLHNTYGKLGAVDRAQAVLKATERGWL